MKDSVEKVVGCSGGGCGCGSRDGHSMVDSALTGLFDSGFKVLGGLAMQLMGPMWRPVAVDTSIRVVKELICAAQGEEQEEAIVSFLEAELTKLQTIQKALRGGGGGGDSGDPETGPPGGP
ncbi:MAG: hypothetical protein JNK48_20150 [Bryobacterales bacterium]|nr:hypothetical protein [Bryobacterales bacterium]